MKKIISKLSFFIIATIFLSSCANYINQIHRDLDRAEQRDGVTPRQKLTTIDQFKKNNRLSTENQSRLLPEVKRQYQPMEQAKKRYTADDLVDNGNDGSLWAGQGNENYLFTKNKWKRNGDIILVNVQSKLKNDITMELKRAFPLPIPTKKAEPKPGETADPNAPPVAAAPVTPGADEREVADDEKIHDRISSIIIEEISKDHLLLKGQKYILFRNSKHLIEVQALISRKDIMDDDTINSSNFLETSLTVLR